MEGWALDLGTTNSALARWSRAAGQPELLELPALCRAPGGGDVLEAPRLVPSAVHLLRRPRPAGRHRLVGAFVDALLPGREALVGRPALERNRTGAHPAFAPSFKAALGVEPGRPLARLGATPVPARGVATAFLRELLAEAKRVSGHRVRDLVVAAPVDAFETYRAEVQRLLRGLGVKAVRFVDEPLAAALGYGLGLSRETRVLVVDVGAGTMHVELVRLTPRVAERGHAHVVAKRGGPLGGNAVDGWVLRDACLRMAAPIDDGPGGEDLRFWRRLMLAEACRVKEALYFEETATFLLAPPGLLEVGARRPGTGFVNFTREGLAELLRAHGFHAALERAIAGVLEDGRTSAGDVDEVLLVGGSTLLPGVYSLVERLFGPGRLRAWQPFEAVALGAACFAAGEVGTTDFIVHDYAIVTHDAGTGAERLATVVPRGTRYPTEPDFWKRQLVPTCSLGEPEKVFKLVICEVARAGSGVGLVWDAAGDPLKVGGRTGQEEVVVPLNATSPTLGFLDPAHPPGDRRPRLEVAFGVNADRWLVASVLDLRTRRSLMREEPVVRLV
ncbi:MAG: Hsp70 family protein [Thermoanaerobaculia bacterium]|nr:Hsp70 family protein [Thermoanaerobaculia bacterium]